MPTSQTADQIQIAYKFQSGLGAPASGSGAVGLDVKPGQSLKLVKAKVPNETVRRDGLSKRDRHGSRSSMAAYALELAVGIADDLFEAIQRGTWAASVALTSTYFTSITTTTNTIVAASGSWLTTPGLRRGAMVKLSGSAISGNNGRWVRVVDVSASTLTLPTASLTANAVADSGVTVTVAKTVIAGSPIVERYATLEEYGTNIDASILGTDMKVTKMDFNAQPNKNIEVSFTFMGRDAIPLEGAAAPNFTSPVYTASLPMVMVDGIIRVNGVDYNSITGFQFSYDMGGVVTPVVSSRIGPDVYLGKAKLTGTMSAIREDMTFLNAYSDETPVEFFILCAENEANPADFVAFYIGDATFGDNSTQIADSGPMIENAPWSAGVDEAGVSRAQTMLKISASV